MATRKMLERAEEQDRADAGTRNGPIEIDADKEPSSPTNKPKRKASAALDAGRFLA